MNSSHIIQVIVNLGLLASLAGARAAANPPRTVRLLFDDEALAAPSAATELSLDVLVRQVLVRNPSLAQMAAAWEAASARYPQVTSLEDPMFGVTVGPASFGSR